MLERIFSKQNRALLSELVRTDFKLRYQGSILGYAWSLLRPILLFAILYVVFVYFLKTGAGIPHYAVYLLLGIVIWNFFDDMTRQSLTSIVDRGSLIRKIKLPNWVIIVSSSISAVISLLLNLVVVAALIVFNHVDLGLSVLLLPLFLIEVYLFGLGLSFLLSALYVRFRDLSYIWEVLMRAGFYLTPIVYPVSRIPNLALKKIILLNPMSQAIQDARFVVVGKTAATTSSVFHSYWYQYVPLVMLVVVLVLGFVYFRRSSKYFAEEI